MHFVLESVFHKQKNKHQRQNLSTTSVILKGIDQIGVCLCLCACVSACALTDPGFDRLLHNELLLPACQAVVYRRPHTAYV